MRFCSNIILNIPQYYFHMAAILKNGCHFFPAEYRQGSPPRSCAGRSPEHVDTPHVFTTAHVRWTPKTGFCPLGIRGYRLSGIIIPIPYFPLLFFSSPIKGPLYPLAMPVPVVQPGFVNLG